METVEERADPVNSGILLLTLAAALFGVFVALVVYGFARKQFDVAPQQFTRLDREGITISAGAYYLLLSRLYIFISALAILGVILSYYQRSVGRYLIFEIYTIGIVRAIFAILFEDRYGLFGVMIMLALAVTGTVVLYKVSKNSRVEFLIVMSQLLAMMVFFILVPITILEPLPWELFGID